VLRLELGAEDAIEAERPLLLLMLLDAEVEDNDDIGPTLEGPFMRPLGFVVEDELVPSDREDA
jgi:hypothetical protein